MFVGRYDSFDLRIGCWTVSNGLRIGWAADRLGRKKGVAIGASLSLLGAALMSGSVNSNMVRTTHMKWLSASEETLTKISCR